MQISATASVSVVYGNSFVLNKQKSAMCFSCTISPLIITNYVPYVHSTIHLPNTNKSRYTLPVTYRFTYTTNASLYAVPHTITAILCYDLIVDISHIFL